MKVYWLEYQLSRERNFENLYADKDVKAFSSGNLIQSIEKAYTTMRLAARKDEEDYFENVSKSRDIANLYNLKDNYSSLGKIIKTL